ncbi:MAG: NUDIX hydrolase [Clostridia bacterium]
MKAINLKRQLQEYIPFNQQEKKEKDVMIDYIDTFDNILTRDNEFAHFTASNWIVNHDKTKVLMAYHNIYPSWAWTGGHSDGIEDLQEVAKREANEETGIENLKLLSNGIYSIEILPVDGHVKRENYVASHLHLNITYLWEADENQITRIKEDENSSVKWIDIDKVIEASSEERMKIVYQKLNQKLKIREEKG